VPRERLSSAQTFFLKVVFPPLWIGVYGAATVVMFVASELPPKPGQPPLPDWVKWLFLGTLLGAGVLIVWACGRLKQVEMDGQNLYVSNFRREIAVPLREVEEVRQSRWVNHHQVVIELRRDSDFGSTLLFLPKIRPLLLWREHPVVERLRQAVREAQRPGAHGVR